MGCGVAKEAEISYNEHKTLLIIILNYKIERGSAYAVGHTNR
ncbi:hypothetical protein HMPREF9413_4294 [Paenibacillus sp. HGF7]|nr:hypothetical protein HMPREF9413_4294 [Paenibacillus sp. HGF7]